MLKALWIALFSFAVTVETGTAQTTALDVTARLAPAKPIKGSVCLSRNCTAGLRSIRTGSRTARVSQTRRHGHHERRSTGLLREKYLTRTGETVPHAGMSQGAPMTAFDYWIMERDNRIQRSVCSNCWHDTRLAALCRHGEIALFSESPPDRQR